VTFNARLSGKFIARPVALVLLASALMVPSRLHADVSRAQEVRARVFKLLNEGIQAYKEGRQKDAIPLLREAANTALSSFSAYYFLGLALKADRQYQAAVEPLQVALELDPVNLQAHVALGDCYLRKGDPTEALAEYHRALALQDDYAPAWDGLGRAAETSGDDEKAIEHYRKAIKLNPGFPDPALNLGDLFMRDGRYLEAIDLFLQAIKVRPDFAAAYNRLGVAYSRMRLNNEAIAALRQAETLEKGNPWHPVTIGGIFQELDSLVQAQREFDAALKLDSEFLDAYVAQAGLQRRQGKLSEALAMLDQGMRRDVDDARTKSRMAEMKLKIEKEARLSAELEARLAANPNDTSALSAMAGLKSDLGDHAGAVALLKRADAAAGAPDNGRTALLGYNALKAQNYDEAAGAYEALAKLMPTDADIFINLGLARIGTGEGSRAEAALREANRLRPGDMRPLAYLGNLYAMNGQKVKAIETLNASLGLVGEGGAERPRIQRLLKALQGSSVAP